MDASNVEPKSMTEKLINVFEVNFFIIKEVLSEIIVKQLINFNRGHTAAGIDGLTLLFLMGLSRPLFLYFSLFYITIQLADKVLPMLGFKSRRISGVGSDRSASCATSTAHSLPVLGLKC